MRTYLIIICLSLTVIATCNQEEKISHLEKSVDELILIIDRQHTINNMLIDIIVQDK